MGVLFRGQGSDPTNLEEVVGQGVGAAIVCWENMEGTGVFNDTWAREILEEITSWVRTNYYPKSKGPLLGLATTAELLEELSARAVIGGYANYKTYDPDKED